MKERILVVEDDPEVRQFMSQYLGVNGYDVTVVEEGKAMFAEMAKADFDLLILDIMLPGDDGLELTKKIRTTSDVPIIMVTARTDAFDRILGLEIGADDYLPKPFEPRELVARIKTVLRRINKAPRNDGAATTGNENNPAQPVAPAGEAEIARFDRWLLNTAQHQLYLAETDEVQHLSTAEYDLLETFVRHPNRVLNRDQLLDLVYGREMSPYDRSIDVLVMRLRSKIEQDRHNPVLVKAIRGVGYMFSCQVVWEKG